METRRGAHHYVECGLPDVVLLGVETARCPKCGEEGVSIPRIEELHRVLARRVIGKHARLAAEEIRFLRKHLGLSGVDLAAHMGVQPETVSRWENGREGISATADRLIRMMVAHRDPVEEYPLEELAQVGEEQSPPEKVEARVARNGWTAERPAA